MNEKISASQVAELRRQTGAGLMECKKVLMQTKGDLDEAVNLLQVKLRQIAAKKSATRQADQGLLMTQSEEHKGAMFELLCETDFVGRSERFRQLANRCIATLFAHPVDSIEAFGQLELADSEGQKAHDAVTDLSGQLGESIQVGRVFSIEGEAPVYDYCHNNRIAVLIQLSEPDEALAMDLAMHVVAMNPLVVSEDDVPEAVIEAQRKVQWEVAKETNKPEAILEKMVSGKIKRYLKEITLVNQAFVKDQEKTVGQVLSASGNKVLQFKRYELGEQVEKQTKNFAQEVQEQLNKGS